MSKTQVVLFLEGLGMILMAGILITQVNPQLPGNQLAVLLLSLMTAPFVLHAAATRSRDSKVIAVVGAIFMANFVLIPICESGALNFLADFYRIFEGFYTAFDAYAWTVEYGLIGVTLVLTALLVVRKVRVSDYGEATLSYFVLQPVMAIFLFEMMGIPAGWFAGTTTRSDLLSSSVNAAMTTFGMIFIACFAYLLLYKFSFVPALVFSGIWWPVWKSFMLHHPPPDVMFASGEAFSMVGIAFLSGVKRMLLPMILIILILNLIRNKRILL